MGIEKKTFLKGVTVYHDTRERENDHILRKFDQLGIQHKCRKLDLGDYSFAVDERDFSLSCVVERKATVNELYGNLINDRDRIEKEFDAASRMINQFVLLVENCPDMEGLRSYEVPDWEMQAYHRKVKDIGRHCADTLDSWQSGNRYAFQTVFVAEPENTAAEILKKFYYYWRNYKIITASRKNR